MPELTGPEAAAYYRDLMAAREQQHAYRSTACQHGLHARCRLVCKFCRTPCDCPCDHKTDASVSPAAGEECTVGGDVE